MSEILVPVGIFILIHFVVSGIVLWIFYKLIKRILLLLKSPLAGTENSSLNLLISFGLTLIFFKDVVFDTIIKIGKFFISPFETVNRIRPKFENLSTSSYDFEKGVSNILFEWIGSFEQAFDSYILNISFSRLIIFVTFWLLISLLIREIGNSIKESNTEERMGKVNSFANNPTIRNIFTIIIVFFSIYLSIASIIAVPEFQVLEATRSESNVISKFTEELDNQKLFDKERLSIQLDTSFTKSENQELDRVISKLKNTVNDYNQWVDINWTRDQKAQKVAINRFKAAVDSKINPRERVEYKLDLTDWYLSYHENWTFGVSFRQSDLLLISEQIKAFTKEKNNFTLDTIYTDSNNFELVSVLEEFAKSRLERYEDELWEFPSALYALNVKTGRIPEKPVIGEKFGIFNTISGWLLKTESLSLALIVGLFGFGLLGSIGSTFIRRRIINVKEGDENDTLILSDLQGILINGISAAIVIFLAVKGAVVIFSTDGNNLNPYVLFFSCLIASVFSEDVWSWARTKLNQNLGNSTTNNSAPTTMENENTNTASEQEQDETNDTEE